MTDFFFSNFGRLLDTQQDTGSKFNLYFSLRVIERMLSDFGPIYAISLEPLFQQFVMFLGPIEALLGIEVHVVETAILVANFTPRKSLSHEKSVLGVVDCLGAFIHLFI